VPNESGGLRGVPQRGVRIHLAGVRSGVAKLAPHLQRVQHSLVTHAYPKAIPQWAELWADVPGSNVIVDSGAFTAHTLGKEFALDGYAAFIDEFRSKYEPMVAELHFMNLDVIGDQSATWRNFDELTRRGHSVMPVLTRGSPASDIDRAAEHEYFACGGLVGAGRQSVQAWLDQVFARLLKRARLPRVHLLGVTQQWALERYPIFSSDSSSWLGPIRYGRSRLHGVQRAPRAIAASSAATNAVLMEILCKEIRHYQELEDYATALWRKRGIEWQS